MSQTNRFCCSDMEYYIGCEDVIIHYDLVFNEYGINVLGDVFSFITITHCPWCGCKLPNSMRDEWFHQLEELGYENPLLRDDLPIEYKSDKWRTKYANTG